MIPREIRDAFFDVVLKDKLNINEAEVCKDFFMDKAEMQQLEQDGFTIGSHTHLHESLEHKDEQFLRNDVRASCDVLSQFLSHEPAIMSYPHGRSHEIMRNVLQEAGFTHGVTIERRALRAADDPFLLPRFDTMDLKVYLDK